MNRQEAARRFIFADGSLGELYALQDLMLEMVPTDFHEKCDACPITHECFAPVIGAGNVDASVVLIGRNPGEDEDKMGIPFIGKGGKMLDYWINWVGFDRNQLYLTNMVKCYTSDPENNRPPKPAEIEICTKKWLMPELKLLHPKLILTFGRECCTLMTGLELKAARMKMLTYGEERDFLCGVNVIAVTHPGAAVRSGALYAQFHKDADFVRVKARDLGLIG